MCKGPLIVKNQQSSLSSTKWFSIFIGSLFWSYMQFSCLIHPDHSHQHQHQETDLLSKQALINHSTLHAQHQSEFGQS